MRVEVRRRETHMGSLYVGPCVAEGEDDGDGDKYVVDLPPELVNEWKSLLMHVIFVEDKIKTHLRETGQRAVEWT